MVTFTCPTCGIERTGRRRRCYPCTVRQTPESRERIRRALTGVRHPPERVRKNSASHRGNVNRPDIAAIMRGRPPGNVVPVGHRRIGNGHWQVKCPDGKFRYEHRVVWEAAHGPIPSNAMIHHKNHDPLDNRLENLEALSRSEHMRTHMLHDGSERAKRIGQKGLASRYHR